MDLKVSSRSVNWLEATKAYWLPLETPSVLPSFLPDLGIPITLLRIFITNRALHANGACFNNREQWVEHVVQINLSLRQKLSKTRTLPHTGSKTMSATAEIGSVEKQRKVLVLVISMNGFIVISNGKTPKTASILSIVMIKLAHLRLSCLLVIHSNGSRGSIIRSSVTSSRHFWSVKDVQRPYYGDQADLMIIDKPMDPKRTLSRNHAFPFLGEILDGETFFEEQKSIRLGREI